jgi:hypothetical protein
LLVWNPIDKTIFGKIIINFVRFKKRLRDLLWKSWVTFCFSIKERQSQVAFSKILRNLTFCEISFLIIISRNSSLASKLNSAKSSINHCQKFCKFVKKGPFMPTPGPAPHLR